KPAWRCDPSRLCVRGLPPVPPGGNPLFRVSAPASPGPETAGPTPMINARNALAFALAAAFAAAPALAQEATPRTNLIYGDTQLALEFQPNCSPGVDCPYFALTCGVGEVGLFVVNLDASHIERWAQ